MLWKQVEKDGSFKVVEGSNRGGRSFVGLGTLLTGCEVCRMLACNLRLRTVLFYEDVYSPHRQYLICIEFNLMLI